MGLHFTFDKPRSFNMREQCSALGLRIGSAGWQQRQWRPRPTGPSMAAAPQARELPSYRRNKPALRLPAAQTTNKTLKKYQSNVSAELHSPEKLSFGNCTILFLHHTHVLSHGSMNRTFLSLTSYGAKLFFPALSPKLRALW